MKKYVFKKYDKNFSKIFKQEKEKLLKLFPKNISIEHIGSTSVPNLGGKGVVDIMVGKNKLSNTIKNKLIKDRYNFKECSGAKDRLFFEKDFMLNKKIQRIHIQLTNKNSKIWEEIIQFRNILRENKKISKDYIKIKKEAVKYAKGEGKKYREYKHKFIRNVLESIKGNN